MHAQLRITGFGEQFTFPMREGEWIIGRLESTDLVLRHPEVLRRHARLQVAARSCQITELRGAEVRVNGRDIAAEIPHRLSPGDIIGIGPYRLVFEELSADEAEPEEEILSEDDLTSTSETRSGPVRPTLPPPPLIGRPMGAAAPPPEPADTEVPGLARYSVHFHEYLPRIYHTDFMRRFLAIFEAVWMPIQWNVDHFSLFLDPGTAPDEFLAWMGSWFDINFDDTWNVEMRRVFLREASEIVARRGTKWALTRLLEIYTGRTPEIIDDDSQDPFTFTVRFRQRRRTLGNLLPGIERLINANKPVHTTYKLEFGQRADIDDILGRVGS